MEQSRPAKNPEQVGVEAQAEVVKYLTSQDSHVIKEAVPSAVFQ
jgi:hypothetical protein